MSNVIIKMWISCNSFISYLLSIKAYLLKQQLFQNFWFISQNCLNWTSNTRLFFTRFLSQVSQGPPGKGSTLRFKMSLSGSADNETLLHQGTQALRNQSIARWKS